MLDIMPIAERVVNYPILLKLSRLTIRLLDSQVLTLALKGLFPPLISHFPSIKRSFKGCPMKGAGRWFSFAVSVSSPEFANSILSITSFFFEDLEVHFEISQWWYSQAFSLQSRQKSGSLNIGLWKGQSFFESLIR